MKLAGYFHAPVSRFKFNSAWYVEHLSESERRAEDQHTAPHEKSLRKLLLQVKPAPFIHSPLFSPASFSFRRTLEYFRSSFECSHLSSARSLPPQRRKERGENKGHTQSAAHNLMVYFCTLAIVRRLSILIRQIISRGLLSGMKSKARLN